MFQSSAGFEPGRFAGEGWDVKQSTEFQSSAGFEPGRFRAAATNQVPSNLFQSSAGFEPGRFIKKGLLFVGITCFNPRPGSNPAASREPP